MALAISIYTLSISLFPVNTYAQTIDTPTESEEPTYVSMIREDRYWIYNIASIGNESFFYILLDPSKGQDVTVRSEFNGTKEINGKVYSRFTTEVISFRHDILSFTYPDFYLREQDGIVYLYITPELFYNHELTYPSEESGHEEILYDFTKSTGESIVGVSTPYVAFFPIAIVESGSDKTQIQLDLYKTNYMVDKVEYVDINGELCKCVYSHEYDTTGKVIPLDEETNIPIHKYIQGIGNVPYQLSVSDNKRSVYCEFLPVIQGEPTEYTLYRKLRTRLVGVYDKEGNQIYAGWPVSAVEQVTENASQQETVYYNMQGQTVNNPVKGEMYIERTGDSSRKIVF